VIPTTVVDDRGRLLALPREPERIVSLAPSSTEVLLAFGLGERLAGVDEHPELPPGVVCARVGGFKTTDVEAVLALRPDLVVASSLHLGRVVPALEATGVMVFALLPRSVGGLLRGALRLGTLVGRGREAASLIGPLEARVQVVVAATLGARVRPLVFVELSPRLHTAGPGTFLDDLVMRAGGINLGAVARVDWPTLSPGTVLRYDPDVLVLAAYPGSASPDAVRARPGWERLAAVKAGRIVEIDSRLLKHPGLGLVDGLGLLAHFLHPDRF